MMHLVTGGSASGKSSCAESIAVSFDVPLFYIATMIPMGKEGAERVERHRLLRAGKGFHTLEQPRALDTLELPEEATQGCALLECMGTLVGNELYDPEDWHVLDPELVFQRIIEGVSHLAASFKHLVVVTNEVGADGANYGSETDIYVELLGRINCTLAQQADCVTFVENGFSTRIK